MVVGKPYIHFKISNEPIEEVVDYNYTWATTVEAKKGPINTPTYINSAAQAQSIFGIDMRPYFAQGPKSLIMVRVAASSETDAPRKGKYSFNTTSDIVIYRAEQLVIESKKVRQTGRIGNNGQPITTHDETNDIDVKEHETITYEHKMFFAKNQNNQYVAVVPHRDSEGVLIPDSYIDSWTADGRIVTAEDVTAAAARDEHIKANLIDGDGLGEGEYDPEDYKQTLIASNIYTSSEVNVFYIPTRYVIPAGSTLFEVESEFEGAYDITITCGVDPSDITGANGYRIVISQDDHNALMIRNASNVQKIVNRINDSDLDVVASSTVWGDMITLAMQAYPTSINTSGTAVKTSAGDTQAETYPLIISPIAANTFISLSKNKTTNAISYLQDSDVSAIQAYETHQTDVEPTVTPIDYAINLKVAGEQSLVGGSKGPWDEATDRIVTQYQAAAHKAGLDTLRRIRLAGIFCMYGEEAIQYEYLQHGIDDIEPEKGMNNNETCKWRTILLGANADNRSDIASLINKAKSLNNQYVLFLGHGLIDSAINGVVSKLSENEKVNYINARDDHQLLPYECTQYIAGLRSKLNYGESIFGGQGRKRIRGVGDLDIAPLTSYDNEYVWDPNNYTKLNEAGVLTFTEDYGNITLTDGVTTIQHSSEEDEEGVMNILKYAQNAIYDVCLPYIGRNIDADIENSITTAVEKVLEEMKTTDQTLIDTDEYPAYDVTVSLGSRRNQLLGRIYIYVLICPVHAVRQIEVEMTVQ